MVKKVIRGCSSAGRASASGGRSGIFISKLFMSFVVYILKDRYDRLYIGQTQNLTQRFFEHNSGKTKSLRGRGPFQIINEETYKSRIEAVRRERF